MVITNMVQTLSLELSQTKSKKWPRREEGISVIVNLSSTHEKHPGEGIARRTVSRLGHVSKYPKFKPKRTFQLGPRYPCSGWYTYIPCTWGHSAAEMSVHVTCDNELGISAIH
jgi:hypothetical protein